MPPHHGASIPRLAGPRPRLGACSGTAAPAPCLTAPCVRPPLRARAVLAAPAALAAVGPKPPIDDKVATARWIVANTRWAFIATIAHDRPGSPFNNVISTANITMPSTGHQVSASAGGGGFRPRRKFKASRPHTHAPNCVAHRCSRTLAGRAGVLHVGNGRVLQGHRSGSPRRSSGCAGRTARTTSPTPKARCVLAWSSPAAS